MGARNRLGIGLSYRPARLHRLEESIPWNGFLGSLKFKNTVSGHSELFPVTALFSCLGLSLHSNSIQNFKNLLHVKSTPFLWKALSKAAWILEVMRKNNKNTKGTISFEDVEASDVEVSAVSSFPSRSILYETLNGSIFTIKG
jgi:hypothetical protein